MTPIIKSGIVAHFTGLLKVDKVRSAVGERNRFKVRLEGEALTSDDFIELMEADQEEKARKEAEKKGKKAKKKGGKKQKQKVCEEPVQIEEVDENICQECGANYDEDDFQDAWIGCDNDDCGRWFHYWCAGFGQKPSS